MAFAKEHIHLLPFLVVYSLPGSYVGNGKIHNELIMNLLPSPGCLRQDCLEPRKLCLKQYGKVDGGLTAILTWKAHTFNWL